MVSKKALRAYFQKKRGVLTFSELEDKSNAIANQCLTLPIWHYQLFHLFLPIVRKREVDTTVLLTLLQGKDKQIVIPKTINEELEHYLLSDQTVIRENKWGIPEPQTGIQIMPHQIDVVFVPLLAFDNKGNRIGYGKGYYDGFLKLCRLSTAKIGLSFFDPVEKIEGVEDHDVPLDYCVTPEKVWHF